MSGNSPSRMGVREVGALLNESAQADAVGHGRPVEGIPAINGGEDVNTTYNTVYVLEKNCKTHWEYIKVWSTRPDNTKIIEAVLLDNLSDDKEILISSRCNRLTVVYNNNTYRMYAKHV